MKLHDEVLALRAEVRALTARLVRLEGKEARPVLPWVEAAVDAIIMQAATLYRVTPEEILSQRRNMVVAYARQWVMYEAHEEGISTPQIGAALKRDHTTVLHGIRAEQNRRKALPNSENLAKIEAGRGLLTQLPDPDRNRDTLEVRDAS